MRAFVVNVCSGLGNGPRMVNKAGYLFNRYLSRRETFLPDHGSSCFRRILRFVGIVLQDPFEKTLCFRHLMMSEEVG